MVPRILTCILALTLLFAVPSHAQSSPVSFWLGGSLGYNFYSMTDVNSYIQNEGIAAGRTGNESHGAIAYQFEGGLAFSRIAIGLGYERLNGKAGVGDHSDGLEFNLPANAYFGVVEYVLPLRSLFGLNISGSVGTIRTAGNVRYWIPSEGSSAQRVDGTGLYAEGRLIVSVPVGKGIVITPSVGYRAAKISEVETDGHVLHNEDGSNFAFDYSGITAHFGIKFSFGGGR